jgi:hypothetical protein
MREKLATSFLLKVFWNEAVFVVKIAVFPGCSSLSALAYSSLDDVFKKIYNSTIVLFMLRPDSVRKGSKTEELC